MSASHFRPIRLPGHTVTLSGDGALGYVHYECRRDADGARIAGGAISRLNYGSWRAHRTAVQRACLLAIAEASTKLGFAKPEETAPTGVNGAASFSWAQRPEEVRQRCEEAPLHTACIRDEYGREMTGGEFLRMLRANCPIEFTHSIGVHFS